MRNKVQSVVRKINFKSAVIDISQQMADKYDIKDTSKHSYFNCYKNLDNVKYKIMGLKENDEA